MKLAACPKSIVAGKVLKEFTTGSGLTTTDNGLLVTVKPLESVTWTKIAYVPVAVGAQEMIVESPVVHPGGRPEYEYDKVPAPPVAETTKVTVCVMSSLVVDALNATMLGGGLAVNCRLLLVAGKPLESVTVALIVKVPVPVGMHVMTAVFAELQPVGRPSHEYV